MQKLLKELSKKRDVGEGSRPTLNLTLPAPMLKALRHIAPRRKMARRLREAALKGDPELRVLTEQFLKEEKEGRKS